MDRLPPLADRQSVDDRESAYAVNQWLAAAQRPPHLTCALIYRVAVITPNVLHSSIAYYGILRAGAVVVPMNPLLKAQETAFILRDAGARTVPTSPMSAAETAEAAAATETECLVLEPDGFDALLFLTNTATAVQTRFHVGPGDVLFGGLPRGATLSLLTRFHPTGALQAIHRDVVTVLLGVPTMYAALVHAELSDGFDAPRLRLAVSGGASLPAEVLHGFEQRFGVDVLEGYGLRQVNEDGYHFIVDRAKGVIIRGGFNVHPREVEEVLYEHPAAAEAAVVGIPDPQLGEEIAGVVVLKPGGQATAEEIRDHVKAQVAAYKHARVIRLTVALPKGPTGKILKRDIVITATHP
ncbi:AMP-binding protein [Streptomyces sp. NPDC057686]|uniref:AMP-binding protein n=1 Tax=Streptomyces sp. NPDC057686 TaxID=3346212 RepID=UPI00368E9403